MEVPLRKCNEMLQPEMFATKEDEEQAMCMDLDAVPDVSVGTYVDSNNFSNRKFYI